MKQIMDFSSLEFDTLKIKTQLPKNKLDKIIKRVNNILEKKSSIIYKKLQSLVGLLFFTTKVVLPSQTFL